MKEQWERRRPYLELDTTVLTSMIQPYLPGRHVNIAMQMTGGLANTLYKLDVSDFKQPLVMRLYTRDHAACQKDVDIHQLVHGQIPVPELFYADTAGTLGGIPYTITEFVPGIVLNQVLANSDNNTIGSVMTEVGHVLAQLNTFSWPHSGFFGPGLEISHPIVINSDSHAAYINESLFEKGAAQHLGDELTQQLSAFLNTNAPVLDELAGQAALVHADFNPYNILVEHRNGTWKVAALVDWEFAFAGPPLFDVGNMLRNEHRLPPVFASHFVAGYTAAGGHLSEHWRTQIKTLDLLNLCDLLLQTQQADVMRTDLMDLIQRTVSQKEH